MTPLGRLIRARIAAKGPMRIDDFMGICLGHPEHGYYATRDPLGTEGDFVTAPEVSQMFGELIGLWLAACWDAAGRPARVILAELGPGRGTLMADALRAARAMPGFADAAELWLVETSPVLRAAQAERLAPHAPRMAERVEELPAGPLFLVANEFFDALPIRQFRRTGPGWQERLIGIEEARLAFTFGPVRMLPGLDRRFPLLPDGSVAEVSEAGERIAALLGAQIAREGGAALVIDYGAREGSGDTLQAVRGHAPADPLEAPGEADLTAHVGFRALGRAAAPARSFGPVGQGAFFGRLGIGARAERLAAGKSAEAQARIAGELRRLTDPREMGEVFKVMALAAVGAPPGFHE
jgi:NADH dehydrogenase [ubiquinone] 1 alpha subcomplex assembly factor 7